MAKLKDKVFFAYNETNILRLGAQLLLGIQLQETLAREFSDLPVRSQYLHELLGRFRTVELLTV